MLRSSVFLVGSVMLSATVLLHCGGSSSDLANAGGAPADGVCEPGETQTCVGPGACDGGQACRSDGSGWSDCNCGDSGTGGTAGADGSGGSDGSGGNGTGGDGGPECDVQIADSCDEGERCDGEPVSDALDNTEFTISCVPAGTAAVGASCGHHRDCVAGAGCDQLGTCRPLCESNGVCADANDGCLDWTVSLDVPLAVCVPSCDLLGDDCPAQKCVPLQGSTICAPAPAGAKAVGVACMYVNHCVVGAVCVGHVGATPGICTALCDTTVAPDCAAPNEICRPLSLYEEFSEIVQPGVGTCYVCDPSNVSCQPFYPDGCDQESDCDDITEGFGRDYTCGPDGACVEAVP